MMYFINALLFFAVGAALFWASFVGPNQDHPFAILAMAIFCIGVGFSLLVIVLLDQMAQSADEIKKEISKLRQD